MKKIDYQPKQVRIFLALLTLVLFFLAFKFFRQGTLQSRVIYLVIPAVFIAVMLAVPKVFFPLYKAILIASSHLGNFIFAVISIVVFFLILTPIAVVMKLRGKHFMSPAPDASLATYYEEGEARQGIEKQF
jgi:ABC-type transport system involved in cytochrome c biogenesis permease subunit